MLSALGFIPLFGPIIQGLASIFNGFTSMEAVKLQTASQTTIAETQASVQIIQATSNDIGIRIMRDALLLFPVVWSGLVGWDTIVAKHWPKLMWHTAEYPAALSYLPYAVMVFLLGNIGINSWKNK